MSNTTKRPVYLDYHATTPVDPSVLAKMQAFFSEDFGNPHSNRHSYGWDAKKAVDESRKLVSEVLGAKEGEIVFTSGATESNNTVVFSHALMANGSPPHIVTTNAEHSAVRDACLHVQKRGCEVTFLPVDEFGRVTPEQVGQAIKPNTKLVSIIFANNEIGTINPIAEIGKITKQKWVPFHTDAVQAVGKVEVDINKLNVDFLSLSAHKIYGPKGIGALFVRGGSQLTPMFFGGGQEKGMRSGTLNVPGIIGLAEACRLMAEKMPIEMPRLKKLRDGLFAELKRNLGEIKLNGHPTERLPNNLNMSFPGVAAPDLMLMHLKDIACSSGSACASGQASHVLSSIGLSPELAKATLRIGLGRPTTQSDVAIASQSISKAIQKAREISGTYQPSAD